MKRFLSFLMVIALLAASTALADGLWNCPSCGRTGNDDNYCPHCGTRRPSQASRTDLGSVPTPMPTEAVPVQPGDVQIGDIVHFGSYEQDGDTRNGAEPISWIVLDIRDSGLFLLSEKGLEKSQFHSHNDKTSWAGSDARRWLNNTFLTMAFSASQQAAIQDTQVDNSAAQHNADVNKAGREGETTTDKVFLLSYQEFMEYLSGQDMAYCVPTQSAQTHGANKSDKAYYDGKKTCWYWLRSPAFTSNANVVDWSGKPETSIMSHNRGVLRPALWVNISAVSR